MEANFDYSKNLAITKIKFERLLVNIINPVFLSENYKEIIMRLKKKHFEKCDFNVRTCFSLHSGV